jgi:hypothetical protein
MTTRKQIVFDEFSKALYILENGFSSGRVNIYELTLIAKYYIKLGLNESKTRDELVDFCTTHSSNFNEIVYRNLLNGAVNTAMKYRIKGGEGQIIVTKSEMDFIKNIKSKYAKVIFMIIVLAKYAKHYPTKIKETIIKNSDKYYCGYSIKQILRMCKLPSNYEDTMNARHFLGKHKVGHPIFKKQDIWEIYIIDELSEPEIVVENISRILDYFPFYCEKCGRIINRTGKRQKYCKTCYKESKNY